MENPEPAAEEEDDEDDLLNLSNDDA